MEYSAIDRFLKRSGLGADPAFAYLHFLNEPIPQTQANKIILGLYYPEANHDQYGYLPDSTIHLPPNASYHTLLHELGHRHGHYYRNNLTEPYAEKYRIENEYLNPEPGVDPLSLAVNRLCQACPELREGRQICQFCELGGAPKTKLAAVAPMQARPSVATKPMAQISSDIPSTATMEYSNDYAAAGSYSGNAEQAIAKVTVNLPDQLFNTAIEAQSLYNQYAQQIVEQGEQPINIQVWVDRAPTFSTDFYVVMTTTVTQPTSRAVPLAPIVWVAIIAALVVIAFIIAVAAYSIVHTEDFIVKAPGAAIGLGIIALGVASVALIGLAIWRGTSIKQAVTGKSP